MTDSFTDSQKKQVKDQLDRFGYWFEEWDDGSSPAEDISNLSLSNYQSFNKKLLDWIYRATLDYSTIPALKKIKTIVDFERCTSYGNAQEQLSKLYMNGQVPQFGSVNHCSFENFNILFRFYIGMIEKVHEFMDYEITGVPSNFVKRLLPDNHPHITKEKKPNRYIVNGILY
jgi:hypothetical protein